MNWRLLKEHFKDVMFSVCLTALVLWGIIIALVLTESLAGIYGGLILFFAIIISLTGVLYFSDPHDKIITKKNEVSRSSCFVTVDAGFATFGTQTCIFDRVKRWNEDVFENAFCEIWIGGLFYWRTIISNGSDRLKIMPLPDDLDMNCEIKYEIKIPIEW